LPLPRHIFYSKDQIDGVAMGSPLAQVLANLYMGHHERIWLQQYDGPAISFYRTFCLFNNEKDALEFSHDINEKHPNIRFTMATEVKGATSRYFRQFQHWSNCYRTNLKIKITAQNYRRTRTKHREDKKGHGWTKLERIEADCIWINLKNVGPPFFKFTVCQFIDVSNFINAAGKSFSVVMWPWFCKWKNLGLPIWRLELAVSKIKQNNLK